MEDQMRNDDELTSTKLKEMIEEKWMVQVSKTTVGTKRQGCIPCSAGTKGKQM